MQLFHDGCRSSEVNLLMFQCRKVLPALPLLKAAGFEQTKANGEDLLQLSRVDVDLLERVPSLEAP